MTTAQAVPLLEHIRELRRRVMWSVAFVLLGAGLGYLLYDQLLYVLQLPYGGDLYYTTPTGALSFLIKVCLAFGFVIGLPVATYHLLAFIAPVARLHTRRMIAAYLFASLLLAVAGVGFAYFVSLPAALHFLTSFGNPSSVQALITANEYFNFVLAYVAGFAFLFQIPLLIMAINRMTPLKPLKLLGGIKYVVLLSFIVAAILTPTPDPVNQAIMAGPMVVLYLFSIGLVALFGRRVDVVAVDSEVQAAARALPDSLVKEIAAPPAQPLEQELVSDVVIQRTLKPARASLQHPPRKAQQAYPSQNRPLISDFRATPTTAL